MMLPKRNVLQKMEADNRRQKDNLAGDHRVTGQFVVTGVGELTKEIFFPVRYIDKPFIYFGYEMYPDTSPTPGKFPTASSVLYDWTMEEPDLASGGPNFRRYFVGGNLAVTVTGVAGQKIWINWMVVGKALTNPLSGVGDLTTDVIL